MTPRQGKAAAVAALLVGLRLTFDRSWMAPTLLPGTRDDPTPSSGGPPEFRSGGSSTRAETDSDDLPPSSYEDDDWDWRDAPADAAKLNRRPDRNGVSSAFAAARAFGARALKTLHGPSTRSPRVHASASEGIDVSPSARAAASRAAPSRSPALSQESNRTTSPIRKTFPMGAVALQDHLTARSSAREAARGHSAPTAPRVGRVFPLFWPPQGSIHSARDAAKAARTPRPPLLSRLLGRGARRPPKPSLSPPDLSRLNSRRPQTLPGGGVVPAHPFELEQLEEIDPARAAGPACRRKAPHWHAQGLWHDGAARGVVADDRWMWLWRGKGNWWADASPAAPLLRHQGLWWSKERGVWFAVHEGELWSWRRFSEWDAEGLLRLIDGVSIVYSSDFTRVAVITPGSGAILYNASSGEELGRWREDQLPHRRPRPPTELRLPRGI